MRVARLLALLAIVASAFMLGCGDDGESAAETNSVRPAGSPLSKPEYERRFQAVIASAGADEAQGSQERQARRGLENFERAARQLAAINPPSEVRRAHRDYVSAFRDLYELNRPVLEALADGDEEKARRLRRDPPQELVGRLSSARRSFEERGYELGLDAM